MCGIAGFHVRGDDSLGEAADELMHELLTCIDHRGGDATGYAAFTRSGEVRMQKASCKAWPFVKSAKKLPADTRTAILHTRMATQGSSAFPENNHPVVSGGTYLVHNGHVWNDAELFRDSGYDRCGEVDSEAIACAIDYHGWRNAETALGSVQGAMAIAACSVAHPGELLLAKGYDSPLHVYSNRSLVVWASESWAVSFAWKIVFGTAPEKKHIRALSAGEIVRYSGGERRGSRFNSWKPSGKVVTGWSWKDYDEKKSGYSIGNSSREVGERLGEALAFIEERKKSGTASLFSDDLDDDPEIQCAACGEWAPLSELSGFDELLCLTCSRYAPGGMVMR